MNKIYELDAKRYPSGGRQIKKFLYYFRQAQAAKNKLTYFYYSWRMKKIRKYNHIELSPSTKIGPGLYIGHGYDIIINPKAVIGKNVNIHRGVVLGQENRGKRKGAPVIGDNVWIGINAVVVGNVKIGNDVLIAPNSYVNCDVPEHSIVFGNPCIIKQVENATYGYVNNCI